FGCGRVVHIDDTQALGRELVKLLQNPAACDELGQRGRAAVAEHHTWAARARMLEQILKDLIASETQGSTRSPVSPDDS
ncbi:MAG: glycosyltransferase, partial [Nitrospirales bacterium]